MSIKPIGSSQGVVCQLVQAIQCIAAMSQVGGQCCVPAGMGCMVDIWIQPGGRRIARVCSYGSVGRGLVARGVICQLVQAMVVRYMDTGGRQTCGCKCMAIVAQVEGQQLGGLYASQYGLQQLDIQIRVGDRRAATNAQLQQHRSGASSQGGYMLASVGYIVGRQLQADSRYMTLQLQCRIEIGQVAARELCQLVQAVQYIYSYRWIVDIQLQISGYSMVQVWVVARGGGLGVLRQLAQVVQWMYS